jgi:hypothetical protein
MGFCKVERLFHIYPKIGLKILFDGIVWIGHLINHILWIHIEFVGFIKFFYDRIEDQYVHILKFSAIYCLRYFL